MYNTINLKELLDTHCKMGVAATIAVSDRWEIPKGLVTISPNGMVLKFEEKPKWRGPEKISVGLLCLDVDKFLNTCEPLPSKVIQLEKSRYKDIMRDIIGDLVNKGHVAYHLTDAFWQDIGSFQDYRIVHKALIHNIKNSKVQKQVKKPNIDMHPSIFLSYKISKENQAIVENSLSPILRKMKYKIVSGAKLNREAHVSGPPSTRAHKLISACDKLVAIVTPDDNNKQPSPYVLDEVACALTLEKDVYVFIQKNMKIPRHWKEQMVVTKVDIKKPAELIKDVVEIID
jgi:NDP-sugar pyrophosphorylase family protein